MTKSTEQEIQQYKLDIAKQEKIKQLFKDRTNQTDFDYINPRLIDLSVSLILQIADQLEIKNKIIDSLKKEYDHKMQLITEYETKVKEINSAENEEELNIITWNFKIIK